MFYFPGQTKKFKNMFFVLLGDDQQLCYLENDKVGWKYILVNRELS